MKLTPGKIGSKPKGGKNLNLKSKFNKESGHRKIKSIIQYFETLKGGEITAKHGSSLTKTQPAKLKLFTNLPNPSTDLVIGQTEENLRRAENHLQSRSGRNNPVEILHPTTGGDTEKTGIAEKSANGIVRNLSHDTNV
jgi:hypothetical protein